MVYGPWLVGEKRARGGCVTGRMVGCSKAFKRATATGEGRRGPAPLPSPRHSKVRAVRVPGENSDIKNKAEDGGRRMS
jgi:hypothetical protein